MDSSQYRNVRLVVIRKSCKKRNSTEFSCILFNIYLEPHIYTHILYYVTSNSNIVTRKLKIKFPRLSISIVEYICVYPSTVHTSYN